METRPNRFPRPATIRVAALTITLALVLAAGSGCASNPTRSGGKKGTDEKPLTVTAPVQAPVGRIVSVDTERQLAVLRIVPQLGVPDFFERQNLVSRNGQGRLTARLLGSGQRQGNILGVYIMAGRPQLDDEVLVDVAK